MRAGRAGAAQTDGAAARLLVLAPLAIEARAVRAGAPWAEVRRSGMGRERALQAGARLASSGGAILVAGFAGALDPALEPGDVVLASELRSPDAAFAAADPADLATDLRNSGLNVQIGPIASSPKLVTGARRAALHQTGALAVDMESAWIAAAAQPRQLTILRVVLDTAASELRRPLRTVAGTGRAYRALRRSAAALEPWAVAAARATELQRPTMMIRG